ncbi:MAG: hypothetical protein ACR2FS_03090 [Phormidesmis sp.]
MLSRFLIEIDTAFPEHDDELDHAVFSEGGDDGDLAESCQCRDCQLERGELDTVPEPIVFEIFY